MSNLKNVKWYSLIIICFVSFSAILPPRSFQERFVEGTVTGPDEQALPGVGILIKGTTRGTVTNAEGKFRISIPNDDVVLKFSFIGYLDKEVTVGSQTVLSIKLSSDSGETILYCCTDHDEEAGGPHGGPDREELKRIYKCENFKNCDQ